MLNDNSTTGLLLHSNDIKLHRKWFEEMVQLLGIQVIYHSPVMDYTAHGEMKPLKYEEPQIVGVIFEDHITQKTAKKLGWDAELVESEALISVPYDLPNIQIGALFEIPSAFDNTPNRLFRVTRMSGIQVYPASITCAIVPEYRNTAQESEINDFHMSNFNLLNEGFYEDK